MKANIGISAAHTKAVAVILNQLLADEHILYIKTRNYHWNVEGNNFLSLHLFYEKQYNELSEAIDTIAERIRKIGHYAEGRIKDFLKLANLEEQEYTNDQETQLQNLLTDHETLIHGLRSHIETIDEKYKDAGTVDFLTGILKQHEEWAWMLRAYLK